MEYYAQGQRSPSSFARLKVSIGDSRGVFLSSRHPQEDWPIQHAVRSAALPMADTGLDEGMWQLSLHPTDGMEPVPGPYPERRGEPDCVYYLRTGLCGFGMSCRFNHPRNLAAIIARGRGEYPERVGQPECQYYLKTGTCKFGATCKYHHPRDKGGLTGRVQLNIFGLPFRMGEKECAYYMRTGSCKYGATCKFHHPYPATTFMSVPSPLYATTGSPSTPLAQHYPAGMSSWPMTRGPYLASPRLQGPTSFGPFLIPSQGIVSVAGWNAYQGTVAQLAPDGQQPSIGPGYLYSSTPQAESVGAALQSSLGPYSPASGALVASTVQSQSTAVQKESIFPERPGQPECQYYMKTGDCKFGATCRFHHPKDRTIPSVTCSLSPVGLPLRVGAPPCTYYTRYGICKFGRTCKFDHPPGDLSPNLSPFPLTEMTNVAYPVPMNTSFIPLSASSSAPLDIARPVLTSSKALASVSGEFAPRDQLVSKENYEEGDGSVNFSSELSESSLQAGQSLPVHVSTSVASISSLGSESQFDVVG